MNTNFMLTYSLLHMAIEMLDISHPYLNLSWLASVPPTSHLSKASRGWKLRTGLCIEYSSRFWTCCQQYQKISCCFLALSKPWLRQEFVFPPLPASWSKKQVNLPNTGSFRISNFCFHIQLLKTLRLTNTTQGQTNQQNTFKYDTSSKETKNQVAMLFDNHKQPTAN